MEDNEEVYERGLDDIDTNVRDVKEEDWEDRARKSNMNDIKYSVRVIPDDREGRSAN